MKELSRKKGICPLGVMALGESVVALLQFQVRTEAAGPGLALQGMAGPTGSGFSASEDKGQPPWKGLLSPSSHGSQDRWL